MIQLNSITKQFGSNIAVKDVSFSAKHGDIIGFLGPNGAGKTTTMRMLLGLIKPTSGTITIDKLDPIYNRLQLLPTMGYLPENNPLYEDMRVSEYLSFIAQALIGDPEILLLDEPTSGLDPIEQEKIKSCIKTIAKKKIILFSTHILSEVEDVANRLVIINKGELVYDDKKPKKKGSVETLFKKLVG